MFRLVANDFKLNAVMFFALFVLSNIIYLFLARLRMLGATYSLGGIQVGIAFASVMVLALFLREEQNKGQVLYRSIPVSHAIIVSARFFSVGLILIANVVYGLSIQTINARVGPWVYRIGSEVFRNLSTQMDTGYALEHSLLARAIAVIIAVSIAIPLIIRYGTIWRILFAYLILELVWAKAVYHLLGFSLHTTFFLGLSRWMFFAIGFMCILLAISYRLSVWLYGRREL